MWEEKDPYDTSPLLLDSVATPLSELMCSCTGIVSSSRCKQQLEYARRERDNALLLARQYRDMAEECHTEKQSQLEEKVDIFGGTNW